MRKVSCMRAVPPDTNHHRVGGICRKLVARASAFGVGLAQAERVEATTREVELLRADLAATRQNLDKAEADKTRVRAQQYSSYIRCILCVCI